MELTTCSGRRDLGTLNDNAEEWSRDALGGLSLRVETSGQAGVS